MENFFLDTKKEKGNQFEKLFNDAIKGNERKTFADKIVDEIEDTYKNLSEDVKSRKLEKEKIESQIKTLNKRLQKTKNVKNIKHTKDNTEKSTKRKQIKKQIEQLKDQLEGIEIEESGSKYLKGQK